MGESQVVSHCFLLRKPGLKLTSVLEHCCEEETNFGFPFLGAFLTASLRRRRMSVSLSLFTVEIPVNYTTEFMKLFENATH
jgi:hypothetical protein